MSALDDLLANLSSEQQAVVDDVVDGLRRGELRPLRVLATAGSGKSTTMVAAVSQALRKGVVEPEDVIVTTFTAKAAAELKHRFAKVLPPGWVHTEEEQQAHRDSGAKQRLKDRLRVGTFHSLANSAIYAHLMRETRGGKVWPTHIPKHRWERSLNIDGKPAERGRLPDGFDKEAGFVTTDSLWSDVVGGKKIPGLPNWKSATEHFKAKGGDLAKQVESLDEKDLVQQIEILRSRMITSPAEAKLAGFDLGPIVDYTWTTDLRAKAALGVWDFADSLHEWWRLSDTGQTRGVRLIVVDEAQDNTPIQMAIARNLARLGGGRAVYVGDVRQAIYQFRGADPSILATADETEGATTLELSTNYRSGVDIVEAGNAVCYRPITDDEGRVIRLAKEPWSVGADARAARPEAGSVSYIVGDSAMQRASEVASQIRDAMDNLKTPPSAFAILSRKKATAAFYEIALLQKQIPARIQGGSPFFAYRPVNVVMAHVRLALGIGTEATLRQDFYTAVKAGGRLQFAKKPRIFEVWDNYIMKADGGRVVALERRFDAISRFYDDETASRGSRVLLWGKDQDQMESDFENFLDTLQQVFREGSPGDKLKAVGLALHREGIVKWPVDESTGPEPVVETVVTEGPKAAQVVQVAGEGDGDGDLLSALLDISTGFAALVDLAWFSLKARGISSDTEEHAGATGEEVKQSKKEEKNAVTVGTIHSSKGLEWPTVYLNASSDEIPNPRGDPAEEKRLLYVGVTRARDRLVISSVRSATEWVDLIRDRLNPKKPPQIVETEMPEPERLYHVIVRNPRTQRDTRMTSLPLPHAEAVVFKDKLIPDTQRNGAYALLVEADMWVEPDEPDDGEDVPPGDEPYDQEPERTDPFDLASYTAEGWRYVGTGLPAEPRIDFERADGWRLTLEERPVGLFVGPEPDVSETSAGRDVLWVGEIHRGGADPVDIVYVGTLAVPWGQVDGDALATARGFMFRHPPGTDRDTVERLYDSYLAFVGGQPGDARPGLSWAQYARRVQRSAELRWRTLAEVRRALDVHGNQATWAEMSPAVPAPLDLEREAAVEQEVRAVLPDVTPVSETAATTASLVMREPVWVRAPKTPTVMGRPGVASLQTAERQSVPIGRRSTAEDDKTRSLMLTGSVFMVDLPAKWSSSWKAYRVLATDECSVVAEADMSDLSERKGAGTELKKRLAKFQETIDAEKRSLWKDDVLSQWVRIHGLTGDQANFARYLFEGSVGAPIVLQRGNAEVVGVEIDRQGKTRNRYLSSATKEKLDEMVGVGLLQRTADGYQISAELIPASAPKAL